LDPLLDVGAEDGEFVGAGDGDFEGVTDGDSEGAGDEDGESEGAEDGDSVSFWIVVPGTTLLMASSTLPLSTPAFADAITSPSTSASSPVKVPVAK